MSSELTTVVASTLPGFLALAGVIYVRRDTRHLETQKHVEAEKALNKKVDTEAFDRARTIDSDAIRHLQSELVRERDERARERAETRKEIERLQRQIEALRTDLSGAQRQETRLLEHIDKMEATVARLRARLAVAGLLEDRSPDPTKEG